MAGAKGGCVKPVALRGSGFAALLCGKAAVSWFSHTP